MIFLLALQAYGIAHPAAVPEEYEARPIAWRIKMTPGGAAFELAEKKETAILPRWPRSSGIYPCVALDNLEYLLGVGTGEKVQIRHKAFVRKLADTPGEGAKILHNLLCSPDDLKDLIAQIPEKLAGSYGVIEIAGHPGWWLRPEVVACHQEAVRLRESKGRKEETGQCSICLQENIVLIRLFPKVRWPGGAVSLISFNESSFEAYGREQGYNASTCSTCAEQIIRGASALVEAGAATASIGKDRNLLGWFSEDTGMPQSAIWSWLKGALTAPTDAKAEEVLALPKGGGVHIASIAKNMGRLVLRRHHEVSISVVADGVRRWRQARGVQAEVERLEAWEKKQIKKQNKKSPTPEESEGRWQSKQIYLLALAVTGDKKTIASVLEPLYLAIVGGEHLPPRLILPLRREVLRGVTGRGGEDRGPDNRNILLKFDDLDRDNNTQEESDMSKAKEEADNQSVWEEKGQKGKEGVRRQKTSTQEERAEFARAREAAWTEDAARLESGDLSPSEQLAFLAGRAYGRCCALQRMHKTVDQIDLAAHYGDTIQRPSGLNRIIQKYLLRKTKTYDRPDALLTFLRERLDTQGDLPTRPFRDKEARHFRRGMSLHAHWHWRDPMTDWQPETKLAPQAEVVDQVSQ